MPVEPFRAGEARTYRYRLITFDDRFDSEADATIGGGQTLAQVTRSRIGWDALPGQADPPPRSQRRVVLDFAGGALESLPSDAGVIAEAQTSSGQISDVRVHLLPDGGRRATFTLIPEADRGADMRVYLRLDDQPVSETWSYLWEPVRVP